MKGIRDKVQIATKFANYQEGQYWKVRGDPEYVRSCCEASLRRLDVDCIDLYYQHRVDDKVPIEITVSTWVALELRTPLHVFGSGMHFEFLRLYMHGCDRSEP